MARLGLRGVDRFSRLLGCRRSGSPGLRSIHLAPTCGRMETPTHPREPPDSPAAAVGLRWVMLNSHGCHSDTAADTKTVAETCTSEGMPLRVSVGLSAPPASSLLHYYWVGSSPRKSDLYESDVMAAHGDSVLVQMRFKFPDYQPPGYYLYRTGGARPPSLTELTAPDSLKQPDGGWLCEGIAGLLHRGDDEVLLVVLKVTYTITGPRSNAELLVLRAGTGEWERKRPVPIVLDEGIAEEELRRWCLSDKVVPVGDRFLCWVKYRCGFLLSDMAEASPKLRYVALPGAPPPEKTTAARCFCCCVDEEALLDDEAHLSRNMGAAGADAVRFVAVDRQCGACGGPGRSTCEHGGPGMSTCEHGGFSFTVTTWTLSRLSTDAAEPAAWVKDGVMESEELWALPGYEGLPRAQLYCPIVSPANPDVVCFQVCAGDWYKKQEVWMLEVDTRAKALLSVVKCAGTAKPWRQERHFPVELQMSCKASFD